MNFRPIAFYCPSCGFKWQGPPNTKKCKSCGRTGIEHAKSDNKYKAKKTIIDGVKFDSKAESQYYLELKDMKRQGIVKDFRVHPRFELQPSFKKGVRSFRAITYTADFELIYPDGRKEVIDVKPAKNVTSDVFKLKKKMFELNYWDYSLHEVYVKEIRNMRKGKS